MNRLKTRNCCANYKEIIEYPGMQMPNPCIIMPQMTPYLGIQGINQCIGIYPEMPNPCVEVPSNFMPTLVGSPCFTNTTHRTEGDTEITTTTTWGYFNY